MEVLADRKRDVGDEVLEMNSGFRVLHQCGRGLLPVALIEDE